MAIADLYGYLTERLHQTGSQLDLFGRGLTRRDFLLASGALGGAVAGLSAWQDEPSFVWRGRALEVVMGGKRWRIDPGRYGPHARVSLHSRDGRHLIRLRRAPFPGTGLKAEFTALVHKAGGTWRLALRLPGLSVAATLPLRDWLLGSPLQVALPVAAWRLGSGFIRFRAAQLFLSAGHCLSLRIHSAGGGLHWDGQLPCAAETLILSAHPASSASLVEHVGGAGGAASYSLFQLISPRIAEGARLCRRHSTGEGRFLPGSACSLSGEAFATHSGRFDDALLVEGGGILSLQAADSAETRMALAAASVFVSADRIVAVGSLAGSQEISANGATARIAPEAGGTVEAEFTNGQEASLSTTAPIDRLDLPAEGNESVALEMGSNPVEIATAPSTPLPDEGDVISIGFQPSYVVRLDKAKTRLVLRRGTDLLNLAFRFTGFNLRSENGRPVLALRKGAGKTARITVEFPPQHIREQIRCKPAQCGSVGEYSDVGLSGPTRLVFKIRDGKARSWRRRALTVDALTDWSNLELEVMPRARAELGTDLERQLALPGIDPGQSEFNIAFQRIAATLTPPAEHETSLEMASHLFFSPSEAAGWSPPLKRDRDAPPTQPWPLWNVRLDAAGRRSVRAVWSGYFEKAGQFPHLGHGDDCLRTITPRNHWEIVAQTSVYGLPALRRLKEVPKTVQGPEDELQQILAKVPKGGVVRPDKELAYLTTIDVIQDPKNTDKDTGVAIAAPFDDADITLTSLGGIFRAEWRGEPPRLRPEPDKQRTYKDKDGTERLVPEGFALEQLSYRSWLARDSRVVAVEKGFLFPLGIRASFVTVSERRFYPDAKGFPIAFEIQRQFIVTGGRLKTFPAVNQQWDSRDFPAGWVQMRTLVTPDLISPSSADGGKIELPSYKNGLARCFWPRVRGPDGNASLDFAFKWSTQDVEAVTSPLVFVDNLLVGYEQAVREIVAHYDGRAEGLRTATLYGAKHRYAPPASEDDTSFDTDSWELAAGGRTFTAATEQGQQVESFLMDGGMEGADQPPFYPYLRSARIMVQSLDRILGRPQGPIKVQYSDGYRRQGFGSAKHPSDIYLEVLEPRILFDVSGQATSSGGLASPSALVAAISRKSGIVGGTERPKPPPPPPPPPPAPGQRSLATLSGAVRRSTETSFKFDQAELGNFDPAEFLGFDIPRLLGIIDLKVVLKAGLKLSDAPRLLESVAYGTLEDAGGLAGIRSLAVHAERVLFDEPGILAKARAQMDIKLTEYNRAIARRASGKGGRRRLLEAQSLYVRDLYPALAAALYEATEKDPAKPSVQRALRAIAGAGSLSDVALHGTTVVKLCRPLLREVRKVIQDPVPPQVGRIFAQFAGYWSDIKALSALISQADKFLQELLKKVLTDIRAAFCTLIDGDRLAQALFGTAANIPCHIFFDNPRDALSRARDSLFADVYTNVLAEMFQYLDDASATADHWIAFQSERLRQSVAGEVARALVVLADRLEPILAEFPNDIRYPVVIDEIAAGAAAGIQAYVELRRRETEFKERIEALRELPQKVADEAGRRVRAALEQQVAKIHPRLVNGEAKETAQEILDDLIADVGGKVRAEAEAIVRQEAVRIIGLIEQQAKKRSEELIAAALGALASAARALAETARFADLSRIGREASGWCAKAGGYVVSFCHGMIAADSDIKNAIDDIMAKARALDLTKLPAGNLRERGEALRMKLLVAGDHLLIVQARLEKARKELEKAADTCPTAAEKFLDPVALALRLRRDIAHGVEELLGHAAGLAELLGDTAAFARAARPADGRVARAARQFAEDGIGQLDEIIAACKTLLRAITTIDSIPSAKWRQIQVGLGEILTTVGDAHAEYRETLLRLVAQPDQVGEIQTAAAALKAGLEAATTAATLRAEAGRVGSYVTMQDRQLTALILQTATMSLESAIKLIGAADKAAKGAAALVAPHHTDAKNAFDALLKLLTSTEGRPIVGYLLGVDTLGKLEKAFDEVKIEDGLLADIVESTSPAVTVEKATKLAKRWRVSPAVVTAVSIVAAFVEDLLRGNLGQMVVRTIAELMRELEQELQQLITQFVPTGIETGYDWSTSIKDLAVFKIDRTAVKPDPETGELPPDLLLSTRIRANYATAEREVRAKGVLQPFLLNVLPDPLRMATIYFDKMEFESRNGSTPGFQARVRRVEIGPLLKFIQPIQDYMSPGGGFYIRPAPDWPGIEAGYNYDAGVIQAGPLQFINVVLGVAARLPFGKNPAQFLFKLASKDRPFLISSPPYGGGGYAELIFEPGPDGQFIIELSFVFGGVSAIRFGPLNAQGRIVAGIGMRQYGSALTLWAVFEAVGEGSLACFSISVCLRVTLTHYPNGAMDGRTEYSFTFKVGWFKFRYKVTAHYQLKSGSGSGQQRLEERSGFGVAALLEQMFGRGPIAGGYVSKLASKQTQWATYRKSIDTDLLGAG